MAQAPPILVWSPAGGFPVGPSSNPPVYSQADVTPLIEGQAYIDIVFGSIQTDDSWVLVSCEVYNTTDPDPLNIWPGIITDRTTAGFRLQLNGMPDSGHYYLSWAVTGVNIVPVVATLYQLIGPTTAEYGEAVFTVRLPPSTTVSASITVTPDDGGAGGSFAPASVILSSGSASQTFTYYPAEYGTATISVTNSGTLTDPTSIVLTTPAVAYTLEGPTGGVSGVASTDFTVAVGVSILAPATITPDDGGGGGTFTPTSVVLSAFVSSVTFTYTPASAGAKTISVTNDGGLTDPDDLTYTATVPSLSDGDPVSTWVDSSGNGNDATMTGSNRPTFKTNIVNGKPVVRFTTAGASKLNLTTPISSVHPWIIYAVMKPATAADRIDSLDGDSAVGGGSPVGPVIVGGGANAIVYTREGYVTMGVPPLAAGWHILEGITSITPGSQYLVVDGVANTSGLTAGATTGNFTTIGYGSVTPGYCDGDIAEIIIYNVNLTGTDREDVEKYLGTKYGISVPSGTAKQPDAVANLVGWWKADSL